MDIINEVYENTQKFEKFSIKEKRILEVRNQLLKLINPQLLFLPIGTLMKLVVKMGKMYLSTLLSRLKPITKN